MASFNLQSSLNIDVNAYNRGIRSAIENTKALQKATKDSQDQINQAGKTLQNAFNVRSDGTIRNELKALNDAYTAIKNSGVASASEIARANQSLKQKTKELKDELNATNQELKAFATITSGIAFATITAGLVSATKQAINLHDALVSINQVGNFNDTGLTKLKNEITAISREIPLTVNALAEIAKGGVQANIPNDDLKEYISLVGKVASAFDILPEEASKAFGTIGNIYKLNVKQISDLADAINFLADSTASVAEKDLVNVLQRTAGAGQSFGLTAQQITALGNTLLSFGKAPEVAGSSINTLLNTLSATETQSKKFKDTLEQIGLPAKQFADLIEQNPQQALFKFLETLKELDKRSQNNAIGNLFGQGDDANSIRALLPVLDDYRANVEKATNATLTAGSVNKSFATSLDAFKNQFQLLNNNVSELGANLGEVFLPLLSKVVSGLSDGAKSIADFVKEFPNLSAGIGVVAGVNAGFLALLGTLGVFKKVISALGIGSLIGELTALEATAGTVASSGVWAGIGTAIATGLKIGVSAISQAGGLLSLLIADTQNDIAILRKSEEQTQAFAREDARFREKTAQSNIEANKRNFANQMQQQKEAFRGFRQLEAQGYRNPKSINFDAITNSKAISRARSQSEGTARRALIQEQKQEVNELQLALKDLESVRTAILADINNDLSKTRATLSQNLTYIDNDLADGIISLQDAYKGRLEAIQKGAEAERNALNVQESLLNTQLDNLYKQREEILNSNNPKLQEKLADINGKINQTQVDISKIPAEIEIINIETDTKLTNLYRDNKTNSFKLDGIRATVKLDLSSQQENLQKSIQDLFNQENIANNPLNAIVSQLTQNEDLLRQKRELANIESQKIPIYDAEIQRLQQVNQELIRNIELKNDSASSNQLIFDNKEIQDNIKSINDYQIAINQIKTNILELDNTKNVFREIGEVGASAFDNLFTSFAQGTATAGQAFKSFVGDVLKGIAQIIAKQLTSNLGNLISTAFSGGQSLSGFAKGGAVGGVGHKGEYVFNPAEASRIGLNNLNFLNGYTGKGGKYDVAGFLQQGSYVINKESTNALGLDFLNFLKHGVPLFGHQVNSSLRKLRGFASGGAVDGSNASSQSKDIAQQNSPFSVKVEVINNNNSNVNVDKSRLLQDQVISIFLDSYDNGGVIGQRLKGT